MIIALLFVIIFILPSATGTANDRYAKKREFDRMATVIRDENRRGNRW